MFSLFPSAPTPLPPLSPQLMRWKSFHFTSHVGSLNMGQNPEPVLPDFPLPAPLSLHSRTQQSACSFWHFSLCIGALPPPKKTSTLCVALLRMWIFYLPIRPQCWFSQFNQHWQKTIGTKRFTKTILYDWDIDCLGTSINFWTTSSSSPTPFLPSRILSNLIEKCFSL